MVRYMRCLWQNSNQHAECRLQAKDYLQCRMDKYALRVVCRLLIASFTFYCFVIFDTASYIADIGNHATKIE